MDFDLKTVPFSSYGSYIAFSHLPAGDARKEGLYLRTVHGISGVGNYNEVFLMELLKDKRPLSFKEVASPAVLSRKVEI